MFKKLNVLSPEEFALLESSEPHGVYEESRRAELHTLIDKLKQFKGRCSLAERWQSHRFRKAAFGLHINERSRAEGSLRFAGTVVIEGRMTGECIVRDTLVIECGARVTGEVTAGVVVCKGEIVGNVRARKYVEIHKSGRLYGDIHTNALQLEEGGIYEGRCLMNPDPRWFSDVVFGRLENAAQAG